MANTKQTRKKIPSEAMPDRHLLEELEDQFHEIHSKLLKARESYLTSHKDEVRLAREKMQKAQARMRKAKKKAARAAVEARNTGTRSAKDQLKKTRAASLLLADSLKEAKEIMVTARSNLHAAKPFDRKLACPRQGAGKIRERLGQEDAGRSSHEGCASEKSRRETAQHRHKAGHKKSNQQKIQ